jgi:gluconolactonase
MKAAWSSLGRVTVGSASLCGALFIAGCGAGGGNTDKPANAAGTNSGGGGATSGGSSTGGISTGGSQNQSGAGATTGGNSTAGNAAGGSAGSAGSGGGTAGASGAGGSSSKGFTCPAGAAEAPKLTGLTPMRVVGVPPSDAFNNNNNDFTNIEGDVWIGDALYVSEINPGKAAQGMAPPSRILKITADDKVSILSPDVGSNGLATNDAGELFGALHKDGSISKISLTDGKATPVASMFMGMRFDSPNDLTIHKNGTIYFTDPNYQAPTPTPQSATRAYRVPPGGMPVAIEELSQPNGITLSKNQDFLFIGGNQLKKYPVMADGSLGAGTTFVQGASVDGMVIDCGDNLYTASNGVTVYSAAGAPLGVIAVAGLGQVTNVAFGGADHKTLYISGQGTQMQKGLFKVAMNVVGFPY